MLELQKLAAVLSGVTVRESSAGYARFVRLSDLSALKAERIPELATGEEPEVARALGLQKGDLIVAARGGSVTDAVLASDAVFGAFVSLDLYLIRPDVSKIDPEYLFAVLTLPSTQAIFAAGKQGSGLARLPKEILERIEIPLPAMNSQRLIAKLASSFEEEAKLLRKLSELNSVRGREVIARAISDANPKNASRRKK